MHLGPAIYSQREWHAERMPIAVRLAPIADPFVLPPPEFDHEYTGRLTVTRTDEGHSLTLSRHDCAARGASI